MRLRRYASMVLAEAFGEEVRDDAGLVWVVRPGACWWEWWECERKPDRPNDAGPPDDEGE